LLTTEKCGGITSLTATLSITLLLLFKCKEIDISFPNLNVGFPITFLLKEKAVDCQ